MRNRAAESEDYLGDKQRIDGENKFNIELDVKMHILK